MDSNMSVLLHLDVERLRRCAWCKGPFTPSVRFNKRNFRFLENRWFACWPMWVCVQVGRSFPLRKLFMGYAWNWINFAFRNCPFFIPEPRDTFRDVVNSLATSNDSKKRHKIRWSHPHGNRALCAALPVHSSLSKNNWYNQCCHEEQLASLLTHQ